MTWPSGRGLVLFETKWGGEGWLGRFADERTGRAIEQVRHNARADGWRATWWLAAGVLSTGSKPGFDCRIVIAAVGRDELVVGVPMFEPCRRCGDRIPPERMFDRGELEAKDKARATVARSSSARTAPGSTVTRPGGSSVEALTEPGSPSVLGRTGCVTRWSQRLSAPAFHGATSKSASHGDPRTTMRYDRGVSLDRHATYIVAAFVAGAARWTSHNAFRAQPGRYAGRPEPSDGRIESMTRDVQSHIALTVKPW
jgi:hypothetical protein